VKGTKVLEIRQEGFGSTFKTKQGTLLFRNKKGDETYYPLFEKEIGTVILKTGGMASVGALATCGFFGINVLIETQRGNPVAILKSLVDDSHVKTRVCQYEALKNGRGTEIARRLVIAKAEGYDQVLKKHDLKPIGFVKDDVDAVPFDNPETFRRKLMSYESKYSKRYFSQIFQQFDEEIRPDGRKTFLAYDGLNNTFNLAYEILNWKVHVALLKAHLEPFLGFLHSLQFGKPSLTCDFMEIYRYLVDDLIISFCREANSKDFVFKEERRGNKKMERAFAEKLDALFQSIVEVPRVNVGRKQEVESLINEEAQLLAKYLRRERTHWEPRIAELR